MNDSQSVGTPDPNGTQLASVGAASGGSGSGGGAAIDTLDTLHVGDTVTVDFSDMAVTIPQRDERIKEDGTITLLEGKTFVAAGKTRGQLEREIHDWYVPRYYVKMTVSISPKTQTQFFYVRGEVKMPNRQIYISRITVLKAIASANDFTDFARKTAVILTRANGQKIKINCKKAIRNPNLDLEVLPGDDIFVPRRGPLW
ncbi:MAG TPA: polysaccharide biosynthesis/export family protein [Verrucomicrobiae bacterium]|nr:polysaccharide biosynthesis/export family protein [Verrucomicrobiae bacterium]